MSPPNRCLSLLRFDRNLQRKRRLKQAELAGLDEAGRGPLAGPVVACALLLRSTRFPAHLRIDDSKRLTPRQRQEAYRAILPRAWFGIGWVPPEEIDRLGIGLATEQAMCQALARLEGRAPGLVLVDGSRAPRGCRWPVLALERADGLSLRVACASIVAKVVRDRWMGWADRLFPDYRFDRHKGYGTEEHLRAIRSLGPSPLHRMSFRPLDG